jgi:serine/threonine protein kinase
MSGKESETTAHGITIYGDLSLSDVEAALKQYYPSKNVIVASDSNGIHNLDISDNSTLIVRPGVNQEELIERYQYNVQELESLLEEKKEEIKEYEIGKSKSLASLHTFHKQQTALFDEFVILRNKYDDQKSALLKILWYNCAQYHPELSSIPKVESVDTFIETEKKIGSYHVGDILGEGQYATVKSCQHESRPDVIYALKMIKKDRVATFTSLRRVSNEIDILRKCSSPYVVSVLDVMHTEEMLYIVTEKGGADLFEFFDEHPDGVPEPWAKDIMVSILKAVMYIHGEGICHRDLKPENILLSFDKVNKKCVGFKLCDFGLSSKFERDVELTDFCGSPGFFAPEMIIKGVYYGDKADIWSVGCILLELVLGHEKFCEVWMNAYDYEVLQDKDGFTREIEETVQQLPQHLHFTNDLNDFILRFVRMRSSERTTAKKICAHKWLDGAFDDILHELNSSSNRVKSYSVDSGDSTEFSPPCSPGNSLNYMSHAQQNPQVQEKNSLQLQDALKHLEVDDRTRHMLEDENQHHGHHFHLPPIEPQTPSVVKARKLLVENGNNSPLLHSKSEDLSDSKSASSKIMYNNYSPGGKTGGFKGTLTGVDEVEHTERKKSFSNDEK